MNYLGDVRQKNKEGKKQLTSVIPALNKRRQDALKEFEGYPWLHVEFKVSLGYIAPCTKKRKGNERKKWREGGLS